MAYRISRNIEASLIDYITAELITAGWSNVTVEKTFTKIYELPLPAICVKLEATTHTPAELGSDATTREPTVNVDIFAKDDGSRLDLKDFLVSVFRGGMPYYEYNIVNGSVQSKVQNGRIRIVDIDDAPVNLGVDKADLDPHDRFRHLLTLTLSLGRLEI